MANSSKPTGHKPVRSKTTKKTTGKPNLPVRTSQATRQFDADEFLTNCGLGTLEWTCSSNDKLFTQGEAAKTLFYIRKGKIKLSVVSSQGKEATVAVLGSGEFVGEECIASPHTIRLATATALTDCTLLRITREKMVRVLHEEHVVSDHFVSFLMARNARTQADLVDHLFNSSEKRLARILLLLAKFGKPGTPEAVIPRMSQEVLAQMVGTTRSRVSFFMNRFRKMGFIEYNGEINVNSSLLNVILHD